MKVGRTSYAKETMLPFSGNHQRRNDTHEPIREERNSNGVKESLGELAEHCIISESNTYYHKGPG